MLSEKIVANNSYEVSATTTTTPPTVPPQQPILLSRQESNSELNNGAVHQQFGLSDANEIIDDLLYRSSKYNPNREVLVADSGVINSRNNRNNNKSLVRQRQPALLLRGGTNHNNIINNNTNAYLSCVSSSMSSSPSITTNTAITRQANHVIPIVVPRQRNSNGSNSYWSQYPSGSEFDTTRIDSYLNAINRSRKNSRSSQNNSNSHNGSGAVQQARHARSRSVEAPLNRLRLSLHKPVNSLLSAINSPVGAKIISSSNSTLTAKTNNSQSRAVLVTRSESLNSEGSSLSGESVICEQSATGSHPAKSVLKKSSPAATVHISPGKKNVTFSAYATIQVMDG